MSEVLWGWLANVQKGLDGTSRCAIAQPLQGDRNACRFRP